MLITPEVPFLRPQICDGEVIHLYRFDFSSQQGIVSTHLAMLLALMAERSVSQINTWYVTLLPRHWKTVTGSKSTKSIGYSSRVRL